MIKSIRALGKASYDDFGLYINNRNIPIPAIKEIYETVPFLNGSYNFTYINGESAYEDRIISYSFDISEFSIEEMEIEKKRILKWISKIIDTDIYDDYIPNYHFRGSAISPDWSEDISQGVMTIKFRVYPFMIANESKKYNYIFSENEDKIIDIINNSDHSIVPIFKCENSALITIGDSNYSLPSGTISDDDLLFQSGNIQLQVQTTGEFAIEFFEEAL